MTFQGLIDKYDYHLRPACRGVSIPVTPPPASPSLAALPNMMSLRSGMSRVAGISGATAIALGAYGAHVLNVAKEGVTDEQRKAFEVANR